MFADALDKITQHAVCVCCYCILSSQSSLFVVSIFSGVIDDDVLLEQSDALR